VFDGIARRIAGGKATPEDWQQAQQWLVLWRDNDASLQPLLARSFLTQDLALVSRNLSQVAIIGLQALHSLKHNRLVNVEVRNRNIDFLDAAAKPQAVLLLMVVPPVETLVKATRTN
jgi:hexosaminidase